MLCCLRLAEGSARLAARAHGSGPTRCNAPEPERTCRSHFFPRRSRAEEWCEGQRTNNIASRWPMIRRLGGRWQRLSRWGDENETGSCHWRGAKAPSPRSSRGERQPPAQTGIRRRDGPIPTGRVQHTRCTARPGFTSELASQGLTGAKIGAGDHVGFRAARINPPCSSFAAIDSVATPLVRGIPRMTTILITRSST